MNKAVLGMRAPCKGGAKHGTVRDFFFNVCKIRFTSREIHISKKIKMENNFAMNFFFFSFFLVVVHMQNGSDRMSKSQIRPQSLRSECGRERTVNRKGPKNKIK
jgi:hypothetical protein